MTTPIFHYAYILESIHYPGQTYIGLTTNLQQRLTVHNQGGSRHTRKFRPWRIRTAIAMHVPEKTAAFERYLKTGSGRAFTARHF